jgi:hypothetical protein
MSHYHKQYEKDALQYRTPQGLYDMKEAVKLGTTSDRNKSLDSLNDAVSSPNKYSRVLRSGELLDVYDVLDAFKVENPAVQHALKKMLCSGSRGYKDYQTDIQEAIDSLERAKSFPPLPF